MQPECTPLNQQSVDDLVEALVVETPALQYPLRVEQTEAWAALLHLSNEQQRRLLIDLVQQLVEADVFAYSHRKAVLLHTVRSLLRRPLSFTEADLLELLARTSQCELLAYSGAGYLPQQIAAYAKSTPLTAEVIAGIQLLTSYFRSFPRTAGLRKHILTLEKLAPPAETELPLQPGEAWSDQAIAAIRTLPAPVQAQWRQLLTHCGRAAGAAPTSKWRAEAVRFCEQLDQFQFQQFFCEWSQLVGKPRTSPLVRQHAWGPDPNDVFDDTNADILQGLAWLGAEREDSNIARVLTGIALSAYRKVPNVGPRCVRVGNACVWALGNMPGIAGIQQLAILQAKEKYGGAQKAIAKALSAAADRAELSPDELEEMCMPSYGLTTVGRSEEQVGDFTAVLTVQDPRTTKIAWLRHDGTSQQSPPKAVKSGHAQRLKELQQTAKEIQRMLSAQRDRLDNMYLMRRAWPHAVWQQRYLDHPVMGVLARRLIWRFTDGDLVQDAIWCDGQIVDCHNRPICNVTPSTMVTLWHPIEATPGAIVAWRSWLEAHELQQPFKQAHREIYLLTDAERQTWTYSNRFAAHILKQHQFSALCSVRHWSNKLRLSVDDVYPPAMKELPAWGLRAEFWIEGIGQTYGIDTNDAGVFLRIATDQVRFYLATSPLNYAHAGGGGYRGGRYQREAPHEPLPLQQVPALVFSEVMRDVDLFVGVASLGNDPVWADGGPEGRYRQYWADYAFGELEETAKTRKQVLERLVPKLKIAERCMVEDRYLIVRGDWRTYKIHLGSGNILMEPNAQYLCIVPGRGDTDALAQPLFLPFDGDRTLSIILSKAFLLASDSTITDETILRQIRS